MENRWVVYTEDGTEICDCDTRQDAIRAMRERATRFPGTAYLLTENSCVEQNDAGTLCQVGSERFIF